MRTSQPLAISAIAACLLIAAVRPSTAAVRTWTGAVDQDWGNLNNWSGLTVPVNGDDVLVDGSATTNVILSSTSADLATFTITNQSLVFTNWSTQLKATTVAIKNGGILTLPPAFRDNAMSNRIYVACTDITLENGGTLNADGKGYRGTNGPGRGLTTANRGGGGAHGGRGGKDDGFALGGVPYDSATAPSQPGSGGGFSSATNGAGPGGGVVRIDASGTATINGLISADGSNSAPAAAYSDGAGAGGSVHITCQTFAGATGLLRADGGTTPDNSGAFKWAGAGGGGRIAVAYTNGAGAQVRFSTKAGQGYADFPSGGTNISASTLWHFAAGWGTVYLSDTALLSPATLSATFTNVYLILGVSQWSVTNLVVSNLTLTFAGDGFTLNVSSNLTVGANTQFGMGAFSRDLIATPSVLNCSGNLIVTNAGRFYVYAGATNAPGPTGAIVNVANDILVAPSSFILPVTSDTNGASVYFRAAGVSIASNGGFNANGRGYAADEGPGKGIDLANNRGGGGGYGGKGGRGQAVSSTGGAAYGSSNAPTFAGSGGAIAYKAGRGGGKIHIRADNAVVLEGTLDASGQNQLGGDGTGGAGSGGTILVDCRQFSGVAGRLLARGGIGEPIYSGGGGGGRIAIWVAEVGMNDADRAILESGGLPPRITITNALAGFTGVATVTNGHGFTADPALPGTYLYIRQAPLAGTILWMR